MSDTDLPLIGNLCQIGALPMDRALQVMKAWHEQGKPGRPLAYAVRHGLFSRTQALVLADAPLEKNQPFEKYRLLRKVGEGGMALIYEAIFKELDQRVALKILKTEYSLREAFVTRFKREAGILLHLDHENIVEAHECATHDGVVYLAMGFVNGISVLDLLDNHGSLDEGLALYIATQVGEALQHMHEKGVVHRDVKPDNFIVDGTGHVRMIDLGLARVLKGMRADSAESMTVGTVEYMSPEQCRGADVDIRSDIYALGVSLFQMITGDLPFSGSQEEVMFGHVKQVLEFTDAQRRKIEPPVQFVLKKTMAKDPGDRYQTPREMVEDLHAVAGHLIENRAEVPAVVEQHTAEDAPIAPASSPGAKPGRKFNAPVRGLSSRKDKDRSKRRKRR